MDHECPLDWVEHFGLERPSVRNRGSHQNGIPRNLEMITCPAVQDDTVQIAQDDSLRSADPIGAGTGAAFHCQDIRCLEDAQTKRYQSGNLFDRIYFHHLALSTAVIEIISKRGLFPASNGYITVCGMRDKELYTQIMGIRTPLLGIRTPWKERFRSEIYFHLGGFALYPAGIK